VITPLIAFGLLFGRWWRTTLVVAAVGWPAILAVDGTVTTPVAAFASGLAGLVNAGVGVAVHRTVLHLTRSVRTSLGGSDGRDR
jgi:hypothetical protein